MYKGSILKKRSIGVIFTLLMLGAIESQAQCVVGATDFDSHENLCNPQLPNDETGWFSVDVEDLLLAETAGCGYYSAPTNAIQTVIASYSVLTPGDAITEKAWAEAVKSNNTTNNVVGYTSICANPKLISPLLSEGNGTPMLVNFGTSHDKSYSLGYAVSGLEPGSKVTFTCDAYNLMDYESLAASAAAQGLTTGNINIFGADYMIAQNIWTGNHLSIVSGTVLNTNGAINSGTQTRIMPGDNAKITITATADAGGNATFYLGRSGGAQGIPMGIDNIKVEGKIKPQISFNGTACPMMLTTVRLKDAYPQGTKFSWNESVTGTSGTEQSFSFEPPTEGTYKVTASVQLPGCTAVSSDVLEIEVDECPEIK